MNLDLTYREKKVTPSRGRIGDKGEIKLKEVTINVKALFTRKEDKRIGSTYGYEIKDTSVWR